MTKQYDRRFTAAEWRLIRNSIRAYINSMDMAILANKDTPQYVHNMMARLRHVERRITTLVDKVYAKEGERAA